jgi:hypothetical protein
MEIVSAYDDDRARGIIKAIAEINTAILYNTNPVYDI